MSLHEYQSSVILSTSILSFDFIYKQSEKLKTKKTSFLQIRGKKVSVLLYANMHRPMVVDQYIVLRPYEDLEK